MNQFKLTVRHLIVLFDRSDFTISKQSIESLVDLSVTAIQIPDKMSYIPVLSDVNVSCLYLLEWLV